MDVDALRDAIAQLTPDSDLEQCLEVETGIEHVTDPKVKEELLALYEEKNAINDEAADDEDEDEDEDEDDKEIDLDEDEEEGGFDHDQHASVTERVMAFQAWCAPRREERNRRLNAMMAIATVPNLPDEEAFMKTRARLDAERAARKKARESEEAGAGAAAAAQ